MPHIHRNDDWVSQIKEQPSPPAAIPRPDESNPVIGVCPKCGINLRRMMWYSCQENQCPSGLGPRGTL